MGEASKRATPARGRAAGDEMAAFGVYPGPPGARMRSASRLRLWRGESEQVREDRMREGLAKKDSSSGRDFSIAHEVNRTGCSRCHVQVIDAVGLRSDG